MNGNPPRGPCVFHDEFGDFFKCTLGLSGNAKCRVKDRVALRTHGMVLVELGLARWADRCFPNGAKVFGIRLWGCSLPT